MSVTEVTPKVAVATLNFLTLALAVLEAPTICSSKVKLPSTPERTNKPLKVSKETTLPVLPEDEPYAVSFATKVPLIFPTIMF